MKKPKLICRTPWLSKPNNTTWHVIGGWAGYTNWLCCTAVARFFDIPAGTQRIRGCFYDRKPGPGAVRFRFRNTLGRVRWSASRTSGVYGTMYWSLSALMHSGLFWKKPVGCIRSAWLEIELED